jgi:hypothetical protein
MDPTLARLLGVIVARLLRDGWTPKSISEWVHDVAAEISRPQDVDVDGGLAVAMRTARHRALADAAAACEAVALDCTDVSQEAVAMCCQDRIQGLVNKP